MLSTKPTAYRLAHDTSAPIPDERGELTDAYARPVVSCDTPAYVAPVVVPGIPTGNAYKCCECGERRFLFEYPGYNKTKPCNVCIAAGNQPM